MRYLITSALPYINGIKHLGNLVGSMLPADVYARFLRQQGEEVLYICGTDEHGTPAELAALEENMAVADYCKRQYERQAEVYSRFGLSFDHFGRTSSEENRQLTQHFYQKLDENGYVEAREISQVYSIEDERFLPDRYVVGTCPKCGYEKARGDQCENCTSVLNPTDLINPRSAISGSDRVEVRSSQHLFLRLDQLSDTVRTWVEQQDEWPTLTKSIAMKWLNEGLQSR
ncbi:MAG: class I tRNA ligase family protein, partial [Cyanobacteria bacterium J06639_16]